MHVFFFAFVKKMLFKGNPQGLTVTRVSSRNTHFLPVDEQ